MDINHVIEALRSTTVADGQGQASDYLKKISPVIGFPQLLLRLLHDEQLDGAVRQAAVICFKNIVCQHWEVVDDEEKRWTLNEQDKVIHLCTALQNIMRNDFPERWTSFGDEILQLLRSSEAETRLGALFILHRLCKIYEYTREKANDALAELMGSALPLLQKWLETLITNQDQPACIIQKQILKIFYCLNRFTMNLQILSINQCTKWIHLFLAIVAREVPSECDALPEDERAETVWWKCKKWALKIIQRVFERYGNEGNVDVSYNGFAAHYSRSLVVPVVFALKKLILDDRCTRGREGVLHSFINDRFVSEEVICFTLTYFSDAVHQALVWRALERNFMLLFKNVIFPLLQYSKKEEEMWSEDVEEFLRFKYDVYEDLHQPSSAASTFLQMLCKRPLTMQSVFLFIVDVLGQIRKYNWRQIDGALHMLAIICPQWIKRKEHNEDVGNILSVHVDKLLNIRVIPRTTHEDRFVRLRACYVLHYASEAPFENSILERAIHSLIKCLKEDTELPVRVQSAVAIQSLINDHSQKGTVLQIVRPHIGDLLLNMLNLIKMTRVEDLPAVVDTLVENFDEDVISIAYDVTVQLVQTFHAMVIGQNRDSVDVMGVLSTLDTNLGLFAKHPDIVKRVEPVIRSCISTIFDTYCESYFEEALSLTHSLVVVHVSPEMWTVFDQIYKGFSDEGTAFFSDCVPVLYAFLTNDTDNFLAVSERAQHFLAMCEKALNDDGENSCDERTKAHAVKMLEVFLLQCRGRANHFIPDILRLVFNHLQKEPANENKLGDLKTQLLIAIIAALYCDFQMCSNLFGQMQLEAEMATFEWVVRALYANRKNFGGVHNRKMLIWLLCRILADGNLPVLFEEQPEKFMEWLLTLFGELEEETDLEAFSTPLDDQGENKSDLNVFVLFKHTLDALSAHNSPLLARITDQQRIGQERVTKLKHLMEICTREENLERAEQLV
uniref:Importin N-terminal domain-containing protein n=1 Tax=Globodera rostochiensis TaxID=31243 RepID=A0A914H6Q5_GLORO